MDQRLLRYATRAVPRYTSYPTVPHFSDVVGGADQAGWLAALDPSQPVSLYLHVPFCRELCWYCGCNMKLAKRQAPITQYASVLREEVALVARHLPARMRVSHLHFGGGTPTALEPDELEAIMHTVRAHFDFSDGAELALESDPRTLSSAMIARIGELGFTRASFGVQEFDRDVQRAINRLQPPDMVRRAVDGLRNVGVSAINFDLIYGLPHQTIAKIVRTVALCAEMAPDRLALFGYAHVPWMAKKQRLIDEAALPGASARLAQADAAGDAIRGFGYQAIGLDHFAKSTDPLAIAHANGTLRRNFQGYTTDVAQALIGLGATSIGRTPGGYVQNLSETGAWHRAVAAGRLPVAKGIALSGDDRMRARVIEALMCQGEVDLDAIGQAFRAPPRWSASAEPALDEMAADGLLVRNGSRLAVTDAGAPFVRTIAALFDAYLQTPRARHSAAV